MSAGLALMAACAENGSSVTFRLMEAEELVGEEEHQVYDFIRNHYRRYGEFPVVDTIEAETQVRLPDTPEHVDYYLEQYHNRGLYNAIRPAFGELRTALTRVDPEAIRQQVSAMQAVCRQRRPQQELLTLADSARQVREEYARRHAAGGMPGIPTGWEYWDEQTGGHRNGDLEFLVARPGMGKTWLMVHKARAAYEAGYSVLFVEMEMPLVDIAARYVALRAGLNPDMIRKGRLSIWGRRRFEEHLVALDEARGFHLYAGNFRKTTDDIDQLIQELGPDLIVLDGAYLAKSPRAPARAGRYEAITYVVDDLRTMTLMRDRPIVASTQFGKGAGKEGKAGDLETIGYTDTIATHSTTVLAIKPGRTIEVRRPGAPGTEDEDAEAAPDLVYTQSPYRVIEALKGREGESGRFGINFRFAPTNLSQVLLSEAEAAPRGRGEQVNLDYMA